MNGTSTEHPFTDYSEHMFSDQSQGRSRGNLDRCLVTKATRAANRRGQGENLRAELVAAATELLLQPHHAGAPSLRAVARAAGVAPSAVYLHFASQEDLYTAVVENQFDELWNLLNAADDPTQPPQQRLALIGDAYVRWGINRPGAYQLVFERPCAPTDEALLITAGHAPDAEAARSAQSQGQEKSWVPLQSVLELHQRIIDICELAGMTPQQAQSHSHRLWMMLHGLTSLRLHKPPGAWPHSVEDDLAALLQAMDPARLAALDEPASAAG